MKTKEELNALKEEVEALNKKLAKLTEEELAQVTGGDSGVSFEDCVILTVWLKKKKTYSDEKKRKYIQDHIYMCFDPARKSIHPCDNCDFFKAYQAMN